MAQEMSKSKLLELIRTERQSLEEILLGFDDSQMLNPSLDGNWSIKDILAHIVTWEQRMVKWIEEALNGETPQILPAGMTWDDLDLWNEQTFMENQDIPLPGVLSDFHSSFTQVLMTVESLSEEDLIDPDRFEWRDGKPLWQMVSANTNWHYSDHRNQIEGWINKSNIEKAK
jgi:hypothetical protein